MASSGLKLYQPLREPSEQSGFKIMSQLHSRTVMSSGPVPSGIGASTTPSPPPSSSEEGDDSRSNQRLLSAMESSGNQNNLRLATSASSASTHRQHPNLEQRDSSSGTALSIGERGSSSSLRQSQQQQKMGSSSMTSSTHSRSSSAAPHNNNSSSSASKQPDLGPDDVMIEEKRKRTNGGEGYTVHRYIRGKLLGKGGFAKVYLCTALDTNKQYAVKVVPKANLVKARARQKLQAEIKIHRTLKHRHMCEYKHFFEDRNNCYILLELCHNQSMNEMIKRRKRLTEPEAAYFMTQLLEAVRYMHEDNVIHRDLKLGNLFLDRNVHVKVGDLGLATRVEDKDEKRKTICGTPNYIAPEVIQGDKSKRGHSFEVDIWSMGVILYTLLIGKPPYEAKDVKATYQRIINNEYSFPPHIEVSGSVRDLIESMLQSNPLDRPSLDDIEAHPFLSNNHVPLALPSTALHLAPVWRINQFGGIEPVDMLDSRTANSNSNSLRKPSSIPPRSASSRQPFGFRDPNAKGGAAASASVVSSIKPEREIDLHRIARSALVMSGASSSDTATARPNGSTPRGSGTSSGFQIFDETTAKPPPSRAAAAPAGKSTPTVRPRPSPLAEDALVRRTKALSLADPSPRASDPLRSPSAMSTLSATSSAADVEILPRMLERLDAVLEITQSRKGSYHAQMPRPVSSSCGPKKWVARYVDYTSKYGLGFLLNDGSSGVYFNDSTKTALEAEGESFQYIERRKVDDPNDGLVRRAEATVETYTLSSYPESLKKKVTLLKHFRNYLLEQQNNDGDNALSVNDGGASASTNHLVYVKKWVRTKHAILFRHSNQTVQVVFYDQSEILLTPDERYITYVDKNRNRSTYSFTDELVGSSAELEKRLKYAKEIMTQLISGRR